MPSLFFTCLKTRSQADTDMMTEVESLSDTWSMPALRRSARGLGARNKVSARTKSPLAECRDAGASFAKNLPEPDNRRFALLADNLTNVTAVANTIS